LKNLYKKYKKLLIFYAINICHEKNINTMFVCGVGYFIDKTQNKKLILCFL